MLDKGIGKDIARYCLALDTLVDSILEICNGMTDFFPMVIEAISRRMIKKG